MTDLPRSIFAPPRAARPLTREALGVLALLLAELVAIGYAYQIARPFDCALTASPRACALTQGLGVKVAAILILFALYLPTRAPALRRLRAARGDPWTRRALALTQLSGAALVLWPALALDPERALPATLLFWSAGGAMAILSAALWFAPARVWATLARADPGPLAALVLAGFLLPGLVEALDVLWRLDALSRLTFGGVALLTGLVSSNVHVDGARYIIGSDDFLVMVADGCSGVQGAALITALIGAYLVFNRRDLRFPAAFLLLPVGIVLSLALNIVRIAALIEIGARGAPDLAVNGFHSNAGWLIFTALSLGLIAVARSARVFQAEGARAPVAAPPLFADPHAARILPFVALMSSGMVVATFATLPGFWYPLRAMTIGATLLAFLPAYRGIDWRPDALSLVSGAVIGALWLATRAPASAGDLALAARLAEVSPENLLLWVVFRVLGTALLVPIAEELFFRDYLLRQGWSRGWPIRALALILSAAFFALLHDRWLAAFLSGTVFGLLVWRAKRLGPAVAAHVTANAVIAAWALGTGDWSVI
jgi:exosortase E/protease (VPEID-CTERM system)